LDDSEAEYKIIPENADNGVILSNLPRNSQEAFSFFSNIDKQYQIKSFSFYNQNNEISKILIKFPHFPWKIGQSKDNIN